MTQDEEWGFLLGQLKSASERVTEIEDTIQECFIKKVEARRILQETKQAIIDYIESI